MYLRKIAAFSLTMTLLSSVGFGQAVTAPTPTPLSAEAKAEKAKKDKEIQEQIVTMLDRTIADIGALKLPGNRAVVYALAGDIYWRYDSKRARELFRSGSGELLNYQAEAEREKLENVGQGMPEMFDVSDPRFDFLNLVGGRDPELGLELMAQTRPPAIADAMARIAQQSAVAGAAAGTSGIGTGSGAGTPTTFDGDRMRATQEIGLEQSLTIRAAATDPEKAAKAIKDSLAKGISFSVQPLLQIILQKDEKRAMDLAGDVVGKLTSADLLKNSDDLNGALAYLQFMARPQQPANPGSKFKIFSFSDAQAKEVAYAIASALLKPSIPTFATAAIGRAMPSLEKLVPDKAALLKQKTAKPANVTVSASAPKPAQSARSWDPNDTPEKIIAAANKITNVRDKTAALQSAANKIGQIADEARAKKIIESIPDEKIRAMAQDRFDANRINRMTVEGRLDEAKASVATLTNKRTQIQRLVSLALQYQRKNTPKDLETAGGLMTEAKALTNQFPEDEDELADYMELVRGYAAVEPDVAFRMIEPMMDQFNEMVQASAVLSRYNKRDRTFKKGEMVMRINGGGSTMLAFRYIPQIQLLAQADLDRMNTLTDRFQRTDARTLMRLYVLQGYQRAPMNARPPGM
ncbi:MAG TPA: hypothetical protein PLP21_17515 [Pyrinomonadaceae bacterium]|nr:hypothetical protein [Pyrinomonadaceae bacterium]